MDNIKFIITEEEQKRLDDLLEEVRHKEIKCDPVLKDEKDGMYYAIDEYLTEHEHDYD